MRATRPGQVVGKALEDFSCSPSVIPANAGIQLTNSGSELDPRLRGDDNQCQGKILVFVNVTYADPLEVSTKVVLNNDGRIDASGMQLMLPSISLISPLGPNYSISSSVILSETKDIEVDKSYVDLGKVITNLLTRVTNIEDKLIDAKLISPEIKGEASQSAVILIRQLAEKDIYSSSSAEPSPQNDKVDQLNLTPPEILLSTSSATLANLKVTHDATISGKLRAYEAIIQDKFKVLGETTIGNTIVAGDLSIDGTLSVSGTTISAIPTLYLQSSPLSEKIDLFNGLVTIDNKGNITAQKLTISNKSIATATIKAGQTKVVIQSDQITDRSKVFISSHKVVLIAVTKIDDKQPSFTVEINTALPEDLTFDWWLVDSSEK